MCARCPNNANTTNSISRAAASFVAFFLDCAATARFRQSLRICDPCANCMCIPANYRAKSDHLAEFAAPCHERVSAQLVQFNNKLVQIEDNEVIVVCCGRHARGRNDHSWKGKLSKINKTRSHAPENLHKISCCANLSVYKSRIFAFIEHRVRR